MPPPRTSLLLLALAALLLLVASPAVVLAGTSVPLPDGQVPIATDDGGDAVVVTGPRAGKAGGGGAAAAAKAGAAKPTAAAKAASATPTPTPAALLASPQHAGSYKLVDTGAGRTIALGGLSAYLAEPKGAANATAKAAPKAAVILYSDIYGYRGNGTRLWADRLAQLGYLAVVPDFFQGRSGGKDKPQDRAFIISIPKSNVTRDAGSVMRDLKALYPSVRTTGAMGFCWGGRYATVAAGGAIDAPGAADAAVAYHASLVAPDEFAAVTRPILFVNAADDPLFNATAVQEAETARTRNARRRPPVTVQLKSYEGVKHGFAVRAAPDDAVATAAAESAFQDGVAFLRKQGVVP
jgi:dienelactone hydrolase